jgi:beta-1,4-mannooligosaccharide phosphorylase
MEIKNHWIKKGVVYKPNNVSNWMVSHAYVPTAILLENDIIRIFVAFKDQKGIGRVGYVDASAQDPAKVAGVSEHPCLDLGLPGTFDDNGVTPITVLKENGKLYLYYVGWQLSDKVRYFLFTGLATSTNEGLTFSRVKNVPILDRSNEDFIVRTAPGVIKIKDRWHMIYAGGGKTIIKDNKLVPTYSLKYVSSANGIDWSVDPIEVLTPEAGVEFGLGRPNLIYENGVYKLWYSVRRIKGEYFIGYAESKDLKSWTRLDHELDQFTNDRKSYDNEMQGFASIVKTKYGNYMFYNGNNYGETGICWAKQAD